MSEAHNTFKLLTAVGAVRTLHQPIKKWEPYAGAGYSFATREEALRAGGEEDLGRVAIETGPQFFEVCKECARVESDQLSETGEEWGYRESLWPCPTATAITAALTPPTAATGGARATNEAPVTPVATETKPTP